jgi:hypothetical protein
MVQEPPAKRVVYVLPHEKDIEKLASVWCQTLGITTLTEESREIRSGLTNFFKVMTTIYVAQLNRQQPTDNA